MTDSFKFAYESIKKILNPSQSSGRNPKKAPVSFLCAAKIEKFQDVNLLTAQKKGYTAQGTIDNYTNNNLPSANCR